MIYVWVSEIVDEGSNVAGLEKGRTYLAWNEMHFGNGGSFARTLYPGWWFRLGAKVAKRV